MVIQTDKFTMMGPRSSLTQLAPGVGTVQHNGEEIEYRYGETIGAAIARDRARKADAAKLATSQAADHAKVATLRSLENEAAKLRQTANAKEHIGKLENKLAEMQSRQDTPKPRKGICVSPNSFNAFTPKPAA